jgi:putative redox protein
MGDIHEISLSHLKAMSFEVLQNGHKITLDAAAEFGGTGAGVRPKAMMLSALAGCSAMDIVSLLNKMHVPFEQFSIEVKGELTEEHPKMYHVVDLKYIIKLQNEADKDKMEKAVNLSQEKYCGVAAMFRSFAKLNFVVQYL